MIPVGLAVTILEAAMTAWVRADHLQLRLVAAGIAPDRTLAAAVDLASL